MKADGNSEEGSRAPGPHSGSHSLRDGASGVRWRIIGGFREDLKKTYCLDIADGLLRVAFLANVVYFNRNLFFFNTFPSLHNLFSSYCNF